MCIQGTYGSLSSCGSASCWGRPGRLRRGQVKALWSATLPQSFWMIYSMHKIKYSLPLINLFTAPLNPIFFCFNFIFMYPYDVQNLFRNGGWGFSVSGSHHGKHLTCARRENYTRMKFSNSLTHPASLHWMLNCCFVEVLWELWHYWGLTYEFSLTRHNF